MDFFSSDRDECPIKNCENPVTSGGYCRFHYISNWKDIKKRQVLLQDGALFDYIDEITLKYPVKFLEGILKDLTDEKQFHNVLREMNIDVDDSVDGVDEGGDDDQDIAFETKATHKPGYDE